jgi:hypothetical protein
MFRLYFLAFVLLCSLTNSLIAELHVSSSLIPNRAIGHDPDPDDKVKVARSSGLWCGRIPTFLWTMLSQSSPWRWSSETLVSYHITTWRQRVESLTCSTHLPPSQPSSSGSILFLSTCFVLVVWSGIFKISWVSSSLFWIDLLLLHLSHSSSPLQPLTNHFHNNIGSYE